MSLRGNVVQRQLWKVHEFAHLTNPELLKHVERMWPRVTTLERALAERLDHSTRDLVKDDDYE